jgi:folate-binding protein YgfZ
MLSPASSPYKATQMAAGAQRLPGASVLACEGPEAAAFLQAQTMNDLRGLAPGHWQWNGWLTPKGRLVCLFALWRRDEQSFLLLLPDFPAAELLPLLQRYVFRSKSRLSVPAQWVLAGEFVAAGDSGPARDLAVGERDAWHFDLGGDGGARRWSLLPADAAHTLAGDAGFDRAWRAADLAHGLPRLDASQREAWTPQMLSLQRLGAYSVAKGCYPGQEIVARTHFLGQAKRELVRLRGAEPAVGTTVSGPEGGSLGQVVAAAGGEILAVLAAERPGPLRVETAAVTEAPLLTGLRRPL